MTINLTRGNVAQFTVQFLSTANPPVQVNPSSATLTITYNISSVPTSTTPTLTQQSGGFWTGSWDSSPSDLGTVDWSVSSPLTTNPAAVGTIRVIDP